jgi:Leucine-rich repeat (LRR) protein
MLHLNRYMINGFEEEQIEVDYCNEFLAIHLLSILKHTNQFGQAISRVRLNRTQQNELDGRFFHSSEKLVEKWSNDLPGLKKLNWNNFNKRMFKHLVNLEELKLSSINPEEVDSNIFSNNKNLRMLIVTDTKLTLNSQSFNRLVNLTELDLSENHLVDLPDGLFDSCTALKVVDLSKNEFIKFETSTFQNLVNLEELDLSLNNIKELDSNLFRCNKKLFKLRLGQNKINLETSTFQNLIDLEKLDLSYNYIERADYSNIFAYNKNLRILNISHNSLSSLNNQSFNGLNLTELHLRNCQISYLTEELFNGLVNLTGLYLSDNKIMSLPDGIFQNITNLKYLNISHNQISKLPSNLFNSLVNLEELNLGENEITNIPMGLFDNLNSLKILNLKYNKIEFQEDSDQKIFVGLRKLTFLHLGNNQISILPEGIFKHLVSLEELGIEKNHIVSLPKEFFKGLVSFKY